MAWSSWTTPAKRAPKRSRVSLPPTLEFFDDLEIWVTQKSVKNVSLGVKPPDGRIEMTVPLGTPRHVLDDFVREKHGWIVRKQREILDSPMSRASSATDAEIREWRECVKAATPGLVAKWEPVLGVRHGSLAYRNMTSRWGSCKPSTGRICINIRLALYPPECLEYVVVHELCHLRVSGHGPEFWALVESCLPNYKQARKKLQ